MGFKKVIKMEIELKEINNKELQDFFKIKDLNFKVDKFEELILQDMTRFDEDTRIKLNRDLTKLFNEWLKNKLDAKEQVKINIKGETRSGKSLIGLKILYTTTKYYGYKFNTQKQVCSNQKEYRQQIATAEFGNSFQVDENAFTSVGLGSMTEIQQLKDVMNITAKKNIHTIFITPKSFLDTGATMGLAYFGKDTNNWVSRFLLYSLKGSIPALLGYVVFDVGKLFQDNGCLIYKEIGGCTNPKRYTYDKLKLKFNGDLIKYSKCINKDFKESDLDNSTNACPFYNICKSQMIKYEHKKDTWINKELKGGLDERDSERIRVSLELLKEFGTINEVGEIRLNAKNGKQLKLKVKLKLPKISNSKFTGTEIDEILTTLTSMTDLDFLKDVCNQINVDYEKLLVGLK